MTDRRKIAVIGPLAAPGPEAEPPERVSATGPHGAHPRVGYREHRASPAIASASRR